MDDFITALKALGDETRFRMIRLLLTHDLCVGALADHLSLSKAAVSQHLQVLRRAGLVKGEKRGYWTHYGVNKDRVYEVAERLKKSADEAPNFRTACRYSPSAQGRAKDSERRKFSMCKTGCRQAVRLSNGPKHQGPETIGNQCGEKPHPPAWPKTETS
jgi:DNA-binding transcriptional ArsR family regulator